MMDEFANLFLPLLLRGTCLLALGAVLAQVWLWRLRPASAALSRLVWCTVLIQGALLFSVPLEIPWYEAIPARLTRVPSPGVAMAAVDAARGVPAQTISTSAHASRAPGEWEWRTVVVSVWGLGLAVVLGLMAGAYVRLCRAMARCGPVTGVWAREWQQVKAEAGIERPLELCCHSRLGPLLCRLPGGYRVVVPEGMWAALTESQRQAILRHELTHYLRGDVWMSLVVRLPVLLHWFNPLAWWAAARFEECGEWACDGAAAGPDRAAAPVYAKALLLAAQSAPPGQLCRAPLSTPPLSRRIRRLLTHSTQEDSIMKKSLLVTLPLCVVAVSLFRFELVAKAAPAAIDLRQGPVTVETVKAKHAELQQQLEQLKVSVDKLKPEFDAFLTDVKAQAEHLKQLAQNPDQLSDDVKRRAEQARLGDASSQIDALRGAEKLGDEGALLIAAVAADTEHEVVRREALDMALRLGRDGYRIVAYGFDKLTPADRAYLVDGLVKQTAADPLMPLIAIARDADPELLKKIIAATPDTPQGLVLLAAIAEKADTTLTDELLKAVVRFSGDDGLLLLFAAAKGGQPHHRLAAVKAAVARGNEGLVVVGAAYDCNDPEVRTEVVRAARQIGGDVGQYIVDHALAEQNPNLRQAAQATMADQK